MIIRVFELLIAKVKVVGPPSSVHIHLLRSFLPFLSAVAACSRQFVKGAYTQRLATDRQAS